MTTRRQVLDIALSLPGAVSDMPFDEDFDSTVLRHGPGGRWFGLLMKAPREKVGLEGPGTAEILNLKCDPMVSYGLRQIHPDILPAWHMNKQLWISVRLEGNVPEDTLRALIEMSYALTEKKRTQKQRRD
ncbi:MAG: MmcQ/YjbR family DNA-binding protein [Clostridia bacterium]|nr:MmcQ/YjbR family DNA-binding protein [Clostridia bacterium]